MAGFDDSDFALSSLPTIGEPSRNRRRTSSDDVDSLFGNLSDLAVDDDADASFLEPSHRPSGPLSPSRPRIRSHTDLNDIPPSFFEPPTTRSGSVSDSAEFSLLLGDSQIAVAAPPVPQSPPAAPTDPVVRSASVSSLEFVNIPSGFFDRVEEDERAIELEAAPDPEAQVPAAQVPAAQRTEASGPQGAADSGAQSSGTYRAAKFAKGVEGARKADERLVVPRGVAGVRRPRPDAALQQAIAERIAADSTLRSSAIQAPSETGEPLAPQPTATIARVAPVRVPKSAAPEQSPRQVVQVTPAPQARASAPAMLLFPGLPPTPERDGVPVQLAPVAPAVAKPVPSPVPSAVPSPVPSAVPSPAPSARAASASILTEARPLEPRSQYTEPAPNVSAVLESPRRQVPPPPPRRAAAPPPRPAPPPTGDTTQFSLPNTVAAPRTVTPSVETVSWEAIIESATSVGSSRSNSMGTTAFSPSGVRIQRDSQ